MRRAIALGLFAVASIGVADVSAQSAAEARAAIERKVRPGDRLTVAAADGTEIRGRLLFTGVDALVVDAEGGQKAFEYQDIERIRRRKNGVILGAAIGTAAGLAVGLPFGALADNEGGGGSQIVALCVLVGAGAGTGLDALFGSNRTVYRKPRATRAGFDLQPHNRGAVMSWSVAW